MLLGVAGTRGKLLGLKVELWEFHVVDDLEKLPGNEGELAAGKYVTCMCLDYLVQKLINMHIHYPVPYPSH